MLETKVMVAPNSPSALANASTMPAMTPGKASGKVTVRNAHRPLAPRVAAASSSRRSIASNDSRIARTRSGNAITPQASAAPVQRQMHDAVEQRLAPEVLPRQQPGDGDAERQRHHGRHQRDAERQRDRGPFL